MKKTIIAIAVLAVAGFTGLHSAQARWGQGPGTATGTSWCQNAQINDETRQARSQFMQDTVELRKQIASTRIDLRAELSKEPVDTETAKALQARLFDLQEQLRTKAEEAGVTAWGPGMGRHAGMMGTGMHGMMMGMGGGNCPNAPTVTE